MPVQLNKKAPAFSLLNEKNEKISLKDLSGRWVVLYFYPKDMTPGCTIEGNEFTKNLAKFKELNTVILGVSADSVDRHVRFIDKQKYKHSLLSDESKKMLEKYGVWKEKSMMGKKFMGIVRTTLIIDPEGIVRHVWDKVKVSGHVDDVYNTLKSLQ